LHLNGLTNLSSLGLNGTRITDAGLVHLKGLTNLSSLDLIGTRVTLAGLMHLKGLNKLSVIYLDGRQASDEAIRELKQALPRLKIYALPNIHPPAPRSPEPDRQSPGDRSVDPRSKRVWSDRVIYSEMSDAGPAHPNGLTKLSERDLRGTQVTGAGLVHLQGLTDLSKLNLANTRITDAAAKQLKRALPKLQVTD
jgi:internalin A